MANKKILISESKLCKLIKSVLKEQVSIPQSETSKLLNQYVYYLDLEGNPGRIKITKPVPLYLGNAKKRITYDEYEQLTNDPSNCRKTLVKYGKQRDIEDFMLVSNIASEIQTFWDEGENDEDVDENSTEYELGAENMNRKKEIFFSEYNKFWDDEDYNASIAYRKFILDPYRVKMIKQLADGHNNCYYKKINEWFFCITEQIDDVLQNDCDLELKQTSSNITKKFSVQPEID